MITHSSLPCAGVPGQTRCPGPLGAGEGSAARGEHATARGDAEQVRERVET